MTPDTMTTRASSTEADAAIAQVRTWLADSYGERGGAAARLMEDMLRREGGLGFLTALLDGLMRPEDARVAAAGLRAAVAIAPRDMPAGLRPALTLGGAASRIAPRPTVAVARAVVRAMVGHLVVDARPDKLGPALAHVRRHGAEVNLNLLGEAVLGKAEARRRVERTTALIKHPDVDYVSIKVSAAVAPHPVWAFDEAVAAVVDELLPMYRTALSHGGVFINLDMEEYRDLDLTLAVFRDLTAREELRGLPMGIVLQAYLPDSLAALEEIQRLARSRVKNGGAPLKVRIVKGANLSMERIEAEQHGWRLATWDSKVLSDAHYKRLLDRALDPDSLPSLRVGVAGHNLFDIALTRIRCAERGITEGVDLEMLLGMAPGLAATVANDMGGVRLYTPAVAPGDFDVALAYLARRLEEVASPGNFLADAGDLADGDTAFVAQERAFRRSLMASRGLPARERGRGEERRRAAHDGFVNTSDSDPAVPEVRDAGRAALARAADPATEAGAQTLAAARVEDPSALDAAIATAHAAGKAWGAVPASERVSLLRAVADTVESHRDVLHEVMADECGKTLEQSDPEVSEAIDFARYYAMSAERLDAIEGATPQPRTLTLVTPPWNFPVAIPLGSTLAALAAGSAVILKPAEEAARCGAVIRELLTEAGVPADLVMLLDIDPEVLGDQLIGDERIDQVILTGAYETAQRFLDTRPGLDLRAETSGKNAMVITPSADVDLAVRDLVQSAFGHAGQKCSAASLAILVGSAADSERLRGQLIDAATSLMVGRGSDPATQMGPVILPPSGKLRRALTTLEPGESWWVEPREIEADLWTPGVRGWVQPGSWFHLTECFGPVLGIMRVDTLEEALAVQNAVDYGLTAGLHSLDEEEIRTWLSGVQAGNVYVNRGTTGAIVQRQPFGGWKRSVVGTTVKAGGPHYVASLTGWVRSADAVAGSPSVAPKEGAATPTGQVAALTADAAAWVRDAAARDAHAWATELGVGHDPSALASEYNVLRHTPVDTPIRWDGHDADALVRVVAAALAVTEHATVSTASAIGDDLAARLNVAGVTCVVEDGDAARERGTAHGRLRAVGAVEDGLIGHADLAVYADEPTGAWLEMLPFLREQAVSILAHRYGTPLATSARVAHDVTTGALGAARG
ncbi:bifunctional proline dehydrogenase/L-glutamate gamma-semialdehyde dehydrogenase [Demequina sp. NBRC 110055]|uniref:proline dehydrogenase family protein n=1 Tax=Demequina sp. NBRC 110055 TaxID=1570344 RepID=UPI000A06CE44|nr:bifunctional proline dehydrogenase/L-glutamate gamma-semialdehyde dehydrogenase [Demequina sp. NBRC 110055]